MNATSRSRVSRPLGLAMMVAGLLVALGAWSLPVNLKSISPALLHAAGRGTPTVGEFGRQLVESEKPGPATLVLAAAKSVDDALAGALENDLHQSAAQQPDLVAWGGWDAALDPVFGAREAGGKRESTPVLTFFLPERTRQRLAEYLGGSRSPGVRSLFGLRDVTSTGRFVPARQPGGQPLDALLLLTGLLYQSERFSLALQREIRGLADQAARERRLGELEPVLIDLLSLAQRLDWMQLSELLRRTDDTKTLGHYAHLARVAPEQIPLIYTAALFSGSADRVAAYLIQFGQKGVEDLRRALGEGRGAVVQLLQRQVPVNDARAPSLFSAFGLLHPKLGLALKYAGFFLAAYLLFSGADRCAFSRGDEPTAMLPAARSGVLALFFAALLVVATEPFLLQAAPPSEFKYRVTLPALNLTAQVPAPPSATTPTMDTSTILSVGLFALLQVVMYFICLLKIREVARQPVPTLVKLKLMENEDNLFDGGLYVGIAGTATALVLQVLGVIQPNLLAAYSSNLFGIICVALVKIRHVRPYKNQLILESQAEIPGTVNIVA